MKSKVNELLEHVSKIENGSVTLPELEYSVELARDLYEKLVVMRHKVYEQGILEQPTFDLSPIAFEEEQAIEEQDYSEPISIEIQEPVSEPEPTIFELETETEETFDDPIDEEEVAPEIEMNLEEDKTEFSEETIFESTNTIEAEITDFSDDLERPMPEIQYNEAPTSSAVDSGSWVAQIQEIESHIPSSSTMSKLDTLIGSFGLNERLQFINELFGGSSEAFSDAVKVLDARTGMDSAREKLAEFAASNNWGDADNETITDFVAKIKRRYA
ncbi:MAG: hypothetical protein ACKO7D_11515 [Bacteroidota bacterium]